MRSKSRLSTFVSVNHRIPMPLTVPILDYPSVLRHTFEIFYGDRPFKVGDVFSNGECSYLIAKVYPTILRPHLNLPNSIIGMEYFDVIAGDLTCLKGCKKFHVDFDFLQSECIIDGHFLFPWVGNMPKIVTNFNNLQN